MKRLHVSPIWLLSILGLVLAGYLAYLHYNAQSGNFIMSPGCGDGGGLFDCHLVSLSHYSTFLSRPLAVWGGVLYAWWFILSVVGLWGEDRQRLAAVRLIWITAVLAVFVDAYLAWIMLTQIKSLCTWCLVTYGINIGVFLLSWVAIKQAFASPRGVVTDVWLLLPWFAAPNLRAVAVLTTGWCLTMFAALWGVTEVTTRLTHGNEGQFREQVRQYLERQAPQTFSTDNAPSKGAADATITVAEFSDFLCPSCRRAVRAIKAVVHNHAKDTRLVFKHYPLDQSCNTELKRNVHPGACELAIGTVCADQQGKFWELHDKIFAETPPYKVGQLEHDAEAIGLDMAQWRACTQSDAAKQVVQRDIADARALQVSSTPTFVVNGYVFRGVMAPKALETVVSETKKYEAGKQ